MSSLQSSSQENCPERRSKNKPIRISWNTFLRFPPTTNNDGDEDLSDEEDDTPKHCEMTCPWCVSSRSAKKRKKNQQSTMESFPVLKNFTDFTREDATATGTTPPANKSRRVSLDTPQPDNQNTITDATGTSTAPYLINATSDNSDEEIEFFGYTNNSVSTADTNNSAKKKNSNETDNDNRRKSPRKKLSFSKPPAEAMPVTAAAVVKITVQGQVEATIDCTADEMTESDDKLTGNNETAPVDKPKTNNKSSASYPPDQDDPWEEYFQQLVKFQKQYGHCRVTTRGSHSKLGWWVARQRTMYNKDPVNGIPANRMKRLNDIGFIWDAKKFKGGYNEGKLLSAHTTSAITTSTSGNAGSNINDQATATTTTTTAATESGNSATSTENTSTESDDGSSVTATATESSSDDKKVHVAAIVKVTVQGQVEACIESDDNGNESSVAAAIADKKGALQAASMSEAVIVPKDSEETDQSVVDGVRVGAQCDAPTMDTESEAPAMEVELGHQQRPIEIDDDDDDEEESPREQPQVTNTKAMMDVSDDQIIMVSTSAASTNGDNPGVIHKKSGHKYAAMSSQAQVPQQAGTEAKEHNLLSSDDPTKDGDSIRSEQLAHPAQPQQLEQKATSSDHSSDSPSNDENPSDQRPGLSEPKSQVEQKTTASPLEISQVPREPLVPGNECTEQPNPSIGGLPSKDSGSEEQTSTKPPPHSSSANAIERTLKQCINAFCGAHVRLHPEAKKLLLDWTSHYQNDDGVRDDDGLSVVERSMLRSSIEIAAKHNQGNDVIRGDDNGVTIMMVTREHVAMSIIEFMPGERRVALRQLGEDREALVVLTMLALATRPLGFSSYPIERNILMTLMELVRGDDRVYQNETKLGELLTNFETAELIRSDDGSDEGRRYSSLVVKEDILSMFRPQTLRELLGLEHIQDKTFLSLLKRCQQSGEHRNRDSSKRAIADNIQPGRTTEDLTAAERSTKQAHEVSIQAPASTKKQDGKDLSCSPGDPSVASNSHEQERMEIPGDYKKKRQEEDKKEFGVILAMSKCCGNSRCWLYSLKQQKNGTERVLQSEWDCNLLVPMEKNQRLFDELVRGKELEMLRAWNTEPDLFQVPIPVHEYSNSTSTILCRRAVNRLFKSSVRFSYFSRHDPMLQRSTPSNMPPTDAKFRDWFKDCFLKENHPFESGEISYTGVWICDVLHQFARYMKRNKHGLINQTNASCILEMFHPNLVIGMPPHQAPAGTASRKTAPETMQTSLNQQQAPCSSLPAQFSQQTVPLPPQPQPPCNQQQVPFPSIILGQAAWSAAWPAPYNQHPSVQPQAHLDGNAARGPYSNIVRPHGSSKEATAPHSPFHPMVQPQAHLYGYAAGGAYSHIVRPQGSSTKATHPHRTRQHNDSASSVPYTNTMVNEQQFRGGRSSAAATSNGKPSSHSSTDTQKTSPAGSLELSPNDVLCGEGQVNLQLFYLVMQSLPQYLAKEATPMAKNQHELDVYKTITTAGGRFIEADTLVVLTQEDALNQIKGMFASMGEEWQKQRRPAERPSPTYAPAFSAAGSNIISPTSESDERPQAENSVEKASREAGGSIDTSRKRPIDEINGKVTDTEKCRDESSSDTAFTATRMPQPQMNQANEAQGRIDSIGTDPNSTAKRQRRDSLASQGSNCSDNTRRSNRGHQPKKLHSCEDYDFTKPVGQNMHPIVLPQLKNATTQNAAMPADWLASVTLPRSMPIPQPAPMEAQVRQVHPQQLQITGIPDEDVQDHDILLDGSQKAICHAGNVVYKQIIEGGTVEGLTTEEQVVKFAFELVRQLRKRGCRFLAPQTPQLAGRLWCDVGDEKMLKKVVFDFFHPTNLP